ncbi:MAG: hypothetical protein A3F94_00010 [Candidatus Spechtbacteria bacterium RIFCSPLOWO2_12_FULL_38_22]|uniref:Uncharacterized protein n=1 Tax=Candidatus Spechtbacteria bacterium RIFCSPLOWO2_12_FULL_38_22 TaxID=1802165 RepID=A0A1G2HGJ5_9BACT|nr:MAG: hypothetical protein A3E58_00010 [Candidatus Spechtbacteria bacterium RIFCSPHIGHO2_12_FULL_38_30]OGZ61606.1 MAG: hypothetical protein A3F94_00010 [Candidatus Spechtbacteria bacterium RIFCSPLOWO2_12_FULL_38_22]
MTYTLTGVNKVIAVLTALVTIISLSGVVYLATALQANAATFVDGDVAKTADNPDVYILKYVGAKMFKRLILNPDIFNSYGHLSWGAIKTATQAELDMYTNTNLVLEVNADGSTADPKVYAVTSAAGSDTGERRHLNVTAAEFEAAGLDWDSLYKVNHTEASPSFYPTMTALTATDNLVTWSTNVNGGGTTVPAGAGVSVSLAADSPGAQGVAQSATDVVFGKFNFAGGANTTVSSLVVTRSGLASDNDIANIKLWDGATQLGGIQALNTTTHKATFTGLNWVVPAGMTKVLTVTASLNSTSSSPAATVGNAPRLGVASAADVTATTTVSGSFPVYGSAMTVAGIAVGQFDVDVRSTPAAADVVSGATDVEIASWAFDADSVEGFSVSRIALTEVGSSVSSDVANMKLKINGVQVGPTVAALDGSDRVVFDLSSSPIVIDAGTAKNVYAHADIASGVTTSRIVAFEITEATDVTAFGGNSGGSVTITYSNNTTFIAQTGANQTISQGTLPTIAVNGATNPSAQDFVNGTPQQLFSAWRLSVGSEEDVRIPRMKLNLLGTGAGAVDISNVTLYRYDEATGTETQIGTPTSFSGTVATFGANASGLDSPGLFDIAKSGNAVIHVRADISSSASWTTIEIGVNEIRVDGIQSGGDIGAVVVTGVDALGETVTHNANDTVGTITMVASTTNPIAQDVVPGTAGHKFLSVDFTASGEDMTLSSLTVNLCEAAACSEDGTPDADSGDFSNVKLFKADGTQLGSTSASPTTTSSFSFNLTLVKDVKQTLYVTADIPTDATTDWGSDIGAFQIDQDITATGVASGATVVDPTDEVEGTAQTAVAETLTVAFSPVPYATLVVGGAQAVISKAVLTAGTSGDVRVTSMSFDGDDATALDGDGDALTGDLNNLQLYVDGVQIGTTKSAMTDGTPDSVTFTGLALLVPKNTSKVVELRANVIGANTTIFIGMDDLTGTTDVVATGLSSNTTIYGTGTDADDSGSMTFSAEGTLTVAVDAGTPLARNVAVGATGTTSVEFSRAKFTSTDEAIDLLRLQVALDADGSNNEVGNFAGVYVQKKVGDAWTTVSGPLYFSGTNASADVTLNFAFTSGTAVVPKDGDLIMRVIADLNGTSNGATSVHTPTLYIQDVAGDTDFSASDVDARGVDSGAIVTSAAGTPTPITATNFNAPTIAKTKPVFALCTASCAGGASPSGTLVAATMTVLRFTITADAAGDVIFDGTNHNLEFTVAGTQSDDDASAGDTITVYKYGVATAVGSLGSTNLDPTDTTDVVNMNTTISAGTTVEFYVTATLTDYETDGDTFQLRIANAANDISWDDDTTAGADIANTLTEGFPLDGGFFVNPS